MRKLVLVLALGLLSHFAQPAHSFQQATTNVVPSAVESVVVSETGMLGAGEIWQTGWVRLDSQKPGPTVVVLGGVHGNEPAGAWAARQVANWPIVAGKLIVVPQVNRLGLKANTRWFPPLRNDRTRRDLNRSFPKSDDEEPTTPLSREVWKFLSEQNPDWVFDLHEGFDFHHANPKSVGSSVITFPEHAEFGKTMVAAADNVTTAGKFSLLAGAGPIKGSLAFAAGSSLNCKSFILETTTKSQPVSTRTRQHRAMLSTAFQSLGMVDRDCVDILAPMTSERTQIAVFDGPGTSSKQIIQLYDENPNVNVSPIGVAEMRHQTLEQFQTILFPGGSGSKQGNAIGAEGRAAVQQFVNDGGDYIGICAGAYLSTSHYSWSLNLINASVYNKQVNIPNVGSKSMWYRGKSALVDVEILPTGSAWFGKTGLQRIRYHNGPILSVGKDKLAPTYEVLATFRSEISRYDAQKGTMVDTPAVVCAQYGKGDVLVISPHFESTPNEKNVLNHAVEYLKN